MMNVQVIAKPANREFALVSSKKSKNIIWRMVVFCWTQFNLLIAYFYFQVKPYSCVSGYCTSLYGNSIKGSKESIAMACAIDSNCKAFRHSSKNGFGFLCDEADMKYGYDDWKLCRFGSGQYKYIVKYQYSVAD